MISPVPVTPPRTGSTTFWQAAAKHFGVEQLPATSKFGPIDYTGSARLDINTADPTMNTNHHQIADRYLGVNEINDVAVFTRNPYTRILSMLAYVHCATNQSAYDPDISDWLINKAVFKSVLLTKIMRWCTCDFVYNRTNFQVVRFENYANDIKQIWNLDISDTHHFATGNFTDLSQCLHYYNDKRIQFVNTQYQRDFDVFGYKQYYCYEEMISDLKV